MRNSVKDLFRLIKQGFSSFLTTRLSHHLVPKQYNEIGKSFLKYSSLQSIITEYEHPYLKSKIDSIVENITSTVLDAGCGNGEMSFWLANQGLKVEAIDSSSLMLQNASMRKKGSLDVRFQLHDLNLPMSQFANDSFDIIICSMVIHYIKNWKELLKEYERVLKPKGHIIFTTYHYNNYFKNAFGKNKLNSDKWFGFGEGPLDILYYKRDHRTYYDYIVDHTKLEVELESIMPSRAISSTVTAQGNPFKDRSPLVGFHLHKNIHKLEQN